ncbi:MAG: magnesium/cobalt transporter CorA [Halobacteriota archaeon]
MIHTEKEAQKKRKKTKRYVKRIRDRTSKFGRAPESLEALPSTSGTALIRIVDYDARAFNETSAQSLEECHQYTKTPTVTWINVEGPSSPAELKVVRESFGVHPLVLEDIAMTSQRPKVEVFDDYVFIVVRMFRYEDQAATVYEEQVSIIFGKNYVLTFSEGRNDAFDILKQRISSNEERLRVAGPDYLAYAIIDVIVDQYFLSLEKLGERIEKIEDEVVTSATPTALEEIHDLKTELVFIRESTWPLRELLDRIADVKTPLIKESTRPYFRDVYDHTVHTIDIIETFRDIVSGILDIYLSSVSLKLNEVMKMLTVIGTIFLPLAFIASVYGMNFRQPEVASEWGYPAFWLVTAAIVIVMLVYFRRKQWILQPKGRPRKNGK